MIQITVPNFDVTLDYTQVIEAPTSSGCYVLYGKDGEVLYVGKTDNLQLRLSNHFYGGDASTGGLSHYFYSASMFFEENTLFLDIYETYLINTLFPKFNHHKAFLYKPEPIKKFKHILRQEDVARYEGMRCNGSTWEGKRCRARVRINEKYCRLHKKQEKPIS